MSPPAERPEAVVRAVFEAAARGDKDALFRRLRPGVEWQLIGLIPDQPSFYRGREEVWAYARSLAETFEDPEPELVAVQEVGDQAVARVHLRGRSRADDEPVDLEFSMLLKVQDGRITRADDYEDHEEALTDAELRR
jgi:ketosteroid isomerase-like protein